jgi:DNA-binding NarL/FixJ family response regulator
MSRNIRILLIDDHSLFRESLSRLLENEPDFQVVGSFASIGEARSALDGESVDIVLLDYDLGGESGLARVESVTRAGFEGRVLLVTAGVSDADTVPILKSGISGIFLKHSPPEQLVEAIRKILQGEIWLDNKAIRALVAGATSREAAKPNTPELLSARERAVLAGLVGGLTNKEIAAKLQTSENAVKWAVQQLFGKTGARARSQLVRIALEKYGKEWLTSSPGGS